MIAHSTLYTINSLSRLALGKKILTCFTIEDELVDFLNVVINKSTYKVWKGIRFTRLLDIVKDGSLIEVIVDVLNRPLAHLFLSHLYYFLPEKRILRESGPRGSRTHDLGVP